VPPEAWKAEFRRCISKATEAPSTSSKGTQTSSAEAPKPWKTQPFNFEVSPAPTFEKATKDDGSPAPAFEKATQETELVQTSGGDAKPPKSSPEKVPCTPLCNPGRKSLCPNRKSGQMTSQRKGRTMLSCVEVERLLAQMGVDPMDCSRCILSGIARGFIKITGQKEDLETVIYEGKADRGCKHNFKVKLGDVLYQGDYGGNDYEENESEIAKVICKPCKRKNDGMGHFYFLSEMCYNLPCLTSGKWHNHCEECPDYGTCLVDFRHTHCSSCEYHGWCGSCYKQGCPNQNDQGWMHDDHEWVNGPPKDHIQCPMS